MIRPPPRFDGPFDVFFSQFIEPNLPSAEVVRELHAGLGRYVQEADPIFFLRKLNKAERWRRKENVAPPTTTLGGRVAFTDNSPQWALHALAYRSALPRGTAFSEWLRERLPCHMFDVRRAEFGETLNDFGWHAAHIFGVKDGVTEWRNWSREELFRRFIRNVHPCNLLLLPKSAWQRLGKQEDLLGYAVERYRERYGTVLSEALDWMAATALASGGVPTIQYEASNSAPDAEPDGLVLVESSGGRIHLTGFGARVAGVDGSRRFSVTVRLLDGTVFGPLQGVSALELLTNLDVRGQHFRGNGYFSRDYFVIEGGRLEGKTGRAKQMAERLNALRSRAAQ